MSEIVQVLRRVGTVELQLRGMRVALSPEVERLTSDDECAVIEREAGGELFYEGRGEVLTAQASTRRRRIDECRTSSPEKKPLRTASSSRDTTPMRMSQSSWSRERCFSRWRSTGS